MHHPPCTLHTISAVCASVVNAEAAEDCPVDAEAGEDCPVDGEAGEDLRLCGEGFNFKRKRDAPALAIVIPALYHMCVQLPWQLMYYSFWKYILN